MRFIDTNLLVYAVSTDPDEARKTNIVIDLLKSDDLTMSWQVIQEFYAVVTRRSKNRRSQLTPTQAMEFVRVWQTFRLIPPTWEIVNHSFTLADRYQLPYWDAMILASAIAGKCKTIMSEDFQDGQTFGSLRVVNPFQ